MTQAWQRWSTSDHGATRFEFWRDAVCSGVVESELTVESPPTFAGTMFSQTRAEARLVNFSCSRHGIRRSTAQAARHGSDRLMLSLQCEGRAVLSQNGDTQCINPGDFGLLNAGTAFDIAFPETTGRRLILLPRHFFGSRAPVLKRLDKPARIPGDAYVAPLLTQTIRMLTDTRTPLDDRTVSTLLTTTVDMIGLHFADANALVPTRAPTELTFDSLKRHIDMVITDPELSPASAASACRVSVRTLHRLFARHAQVSFDNYVMEARLRIAFDTLTAARARTVSEAAFACGFNNLSHFTRRFSERFELSPVQVLKARAP